MKIAFPLYLVTDPLSKTANICATLRTLADLEEIAIGRHIRGERTLANVNATLHTDFGTATADAQARLDALNSKGADWIPLRDLRPGAVFETNVGLRGIKRRKPAPEPGRVRVVWLEAGNDGNALDTLTVREVPR